LFNIRSTIVELFNIRSTIG